MRAAHRLALIAALAPLALGGSELLARAEASSRARREGVAQSDVRDVVATATAAAIRDVRLAAEADAMATSASPAEIGSGSSPDEKEAKRRLSASAVRIDLEEPARALGVGFAVTGRDPVAPRALDLWRRAGDRFVRVATGASGRDGTLAFPALVLPAGDVELVAAPRGEGPDAPGASSAVRVRRDPVSPRFEVERRDGALVLQLAPAEPDGEIVVARGDAEIAVAPVVGASLVLAIPAAPDLRVAQRSPDGRLSPWRAVRIDSTTRPEERDHVESDPFAAP